MSTVEICRHCGYGIPRSAGICPGCGRRHKVKPVARQPVPPIPPPQPESPVPPPPRSTVRHRHSPLLLLAQTTRVLLLLTGWAAVAFGLAVATTYTALLDRVVEELPDDAPRRAVDALDAIAQVTLVIVVLTAAAAVLWGWRVHRNLRPLGLSSSGSSAWSIAGWLVPGRAAVASKRTVDALWHDSSPMLAPLPARGWTRRPVSRVVLQWWVLWLAVPGVGLLLAVIGAGADDLDGQLALAGLAAAALLIATARALYDVIGIVTLAQAHRAAAVRRERTERTWVAEGPWAEVDLSLLGDEDALQPLGR